eukprot:XP_020403539.1 hypothetical protein [Zea mays]
MGYSAAARHRRAGADGRPRAARAVPVQIPLRPTRFADAIALCVQVKKYLQSIQLDLIAPILYGSGISGAAAELLAPAGSCNLQPEPEFRPPMWEVLQSLVRQRLVQRANMARTQSHSRRHGEPVTASRDVLVVCSSTGWTDEKHMLYLRLLEETFVHQLHGSGCIFKGLFNCSPRYCRQMKSSKQIVKYTTPGQGCAIVEGGKVKSCIKAEHVESPSCCGNQQDEKVRSLEDNASTTKPMEKATSHARAASPGQASTCYVGKHRHSPSRSAGIKFIYLSDVARFLKENYSCIYSEGSDQNFDEETQGTGESKHEYNPKRLKSADGTRDHQVVNAEAHQVGCLDVSDKNSENFSASSKVLAASLDVEAGSPSGDCKDHGPKG